MDDEGAVTTFETELGAERQDRSLRKQAGTDDAHLPPQRCQP